MKAFHSLIVSLLVFTPISFASANDFEKNEEIRVVMRRNGDDCRTQRPIQHYAYFTSASDRKQYREFLTSRGYVIDRESDDADRKHPKGIIFSRSQAPIEIDDETAVLDAAAAQFGGEYDGWEADIIRKPGGSN
jgi:hypothetical protein